MAWLAEQRPGHTPLVLDALRPQRVQQQLWDALDGTDLRMYLANPERGSIHSFGMALDITILDEQGRELDMGTGFDDLSEKSHPALEPQLLARGEITHAAHRQPPAAARRDDARRLRGHQQRVVAFRLRRPRSGAPHIQARFVKA